MFLNNLDRGDRFRIIKVIMGEAIGKRLVDMGLNRGVEGVLVRCAMLGDPIQIRIRGYNLSLRLAEAAGVEIELLDRKSPAPGTGSDAVRRKLCAGSPHRGRNRGGRL